MEFEIELIFLSLSLSDGPPLRPVGAQPSMAYPTPLPESLERDRTNLAAFTSRNAGWPQNRLHAR
jgi:hypothetical protein